MELIKLFIILFLFVIFPFNTGNCSIEWEGKKDYLINEISQEEFEFSQQPFTEESNKIAANYYDETRGWIIDGQSLEDIEEANEPITDEDLKVLGMLEQVEPEKPKTQEEQRTHPKDLDFESLDDIGYTMKDEWNRAFHTKANEERYFERTELAKTERKLQRVFVGLMGSAFLFVFLIMISNILPNKNKKRNKKLKLQLENKYKRTINFINEQDLPQIRKSDFFLAVTGVPFAFILIFISIIISILFAIGIISLIYYLFSFLHIIPIGIIKIIIVGTVILICVSLKSIILAFFNNNIIEIATTLPSNDNQIRKDINEVCSKLNIQIPNNILLSFRPTFYVTESPITTLKSKYKGRSLVIGIGHLRYLNNNEFKAIIAHEMGHFTGKDTIFSIYIAPLYKGIRRIIGILGQYSDDSTIIFLPMLPLILILKIYYNLYAKLESKISRQREKRADYIATLLYGKNNFCNALTKTINYDIKFSNKYLKDYIAILKEDKMFINYFSYFDTKLNKDKLNDKSSINGISTEYSSHCSTQKRFIYVPKIINNKENVKYNIEHYKAIEEYLTEAMGYYILARKTAEQNIEKLKNNKESPKDFPTLSNEQTEKNQDVKTNAKNFHKLELSNEDKNFLSKLTSKVYGFHGDSNKYWVHTKKQTDGNTPKLIMGDGVLRENVTRKDFIKALVNSNSKAFQIAGTDKDSRHKIITVVQNSETNTTTMYTLDSEQCYKIALENNIDKTKLTETIVDKLGTIHGATIWGN